MKKTALIAFSLLIAASTATAQQPSTKELMQQERDYMTFNLDDAPASDSYTTRKGCTAYNKPAMPEKWFGSLTSGAILEAVYVHQVADNIKKAGKCTCALRFPKWDNAIAEYQERFAILPDDEYLPWPNDYWNEMNRIDINTSKICRSAGVQ